MTARRGGWEELERPAPDVVLVDGAAVRKGSRVRLRPQREGGDVFERALAGRVAVVESIEQDLDERLHVLVVLDDDPGRELGFDRRPGHRFFFAPDELELVPEPGPEPPARRILVAGVGNIFLGDDGFGVALAARLARAALPPGVDVVDFGIRGMDLAFAMSDYDTVVLLDATPRGQRPGTLYVIEADTAAVGESAPDAHGMDPVKVLGLARALGAEPPRTLVVGCEPQTLMTGEEPDVVAGLSEPVRVALDEAERLVGELLADLTTVQSKERKDR
jgi:hydrogenase maturation protease